MPCSPQRNWNWKRAGQLYKVIPQNPPFPNYNIYNNNYNMEYKLELSSPPPDLNITESLWVDLKHAVCAGQLAPKRVFKLSAKNHRLIRAHNPLLMLQFLLIWPKVWQENICSNILFRRALQRGHLIARSGYFGWGHSQALIMISPHLFWFLGPSMHQVHAIF